MKFVPNTDHVGILTRLAEEYERSARKHQTLAGGLKESILNKPDADGFAKLMGLAAALDYSNHAAADRQSLAAIRIQLALWGVEMEA